MFWISGNKSPLEKRKAAFLHILNSCPLLLMEVVAAEQHALRSISEGHRPEVFCVSRNRSQVSQQYFQLWNFFFFLFISTCNSIVAAYSQFFPSNTNRIGCKKEQGWKKNWEDSVPGHIALPVSCSLTFKEAKSGVNALQLWKSYQSNSKETIQSLQISCWT